MGLTRLAEPAVLAANKVTWTARYLAKVAATPAKRPPSGQYAHADIVAALRAMSFGKCFYCEQPLAEGDEEVDHYIEVAEDRARAFDWLNLYLACEKCNDKQTNRAIPVAECLDPCDPNVRPGDHLTFEHDVVVARNDSAVGYRTIQKYGLHRDELNLKRARHLRVFDGELKRILRAMVAEQRGMNDVERETLRRFGQRDHPFSLMFAAQLASEGL